MAPAVATTGMPSVRTDVTTIGTWAWAQFMSRWPPPGTSTSSPTHPSVLMSDGASGAPWITTSGATTTAATRVSDAWYSSVPSEWRACFDAMKYHVHASTDAAASAFPKKVPPAAADAVRTAATTPAVAVAVRTTSSTDTSSPNRGPATNNTRAGCSEEMMLASATLVGVRDVKNSNTSRPKAIPPGAATRKARKLIRPPRRYSRPVNHK